MRRRAAALLALFLTGSLAASLGCVERESGNPSAERDRYGDTGSTTGLRQTIDFEETSVGISGETEVRTLLDVTQGERVWYGFGEGDPYPTGRMRDAGAACEPQYGNKAYAIDELPATIEGVVTLDPRHYEKPSICGQDHRFYGSFYVQDSSGSLLVLRDSRIADFDFGDRVRLDVRGIMKSFGTMKVTAFEGIEILDDGGSTPYKRIDESFESYFGQSCSNLGDDPAIPEDLGDSFRISGRVCQAPTTRNFGEFVIYPSGTACSSSPSTTWTASLGVELEPRTLDLETGDSVTVTGPVTCGFGNYTMVISSIGQFERFQEDR